MAESINIFMGFAFSLFITAAERADVQILLTSTIYILITLAILFVLMPLGYWLFDTAVVHGSANLRRQVFRRALRLSAAWLETKHSGDLTSRTTNDVQAAEQATAPIPSTWLKCSWGVLAAPQRCLSLTGNWPWVSLPWAPSESG
ncbi:MAG: hypothetical protein FH749_16005 [Firmicutes bacterium]|nr:hypothetical protein [Bacillota bacterium]